MMMTSIEAHVAPEKQDLLKQAFKKLTANRPPALRRALLVQSSTDPTLWRALGFWPSSKVFEEYRKSVDTPAGIAIFRVAGVEPVLSVFEIVDQQEWD
jgi:hypothetical protein